MCLNCNDLILLSKIYYTATYFRSSPSSYFFSKAILEHHHLKAKLRINKTTLAFVSFTVDTRTFCKQKMKVWIIIVQNKYKAKIQLKHNVSIMIDFCIARLNCLFDHLGLDCNTFLGVATSYDYFVRLSDLFDCKETIKLSKFSIFFYLCEY